MASQVRSDRAGGFDSAAARRTHRARGSARALHRRAAARAGPRPPTRCAAALSRQHRDLHHRPQHQLHQRLRDGLQVLRVLRAPSHAEGWTHTLEELPAPLRRGGRPRRDPDHVAGRASPDRHRVVRATVRAIKRTTRSWRCTRSARPRSCTSAARRQLDDAEVDHAAQGGRPRLLRRRRAPRSWSNGRARRSRRSRSRARSGSRSWRPRTGSASSRPPRS